MTWTRLPDVPLPVHGTFCARRGAQAGGAGERGGALGERWLGIGAMGEDAARSHLMGGGDGTGGHDGGEGQDGQHGSGAAEHGGYLGGMGRVAGSDPRSRAKVGRLPRSRLRLRP